MDVTIDANFIMATCAVFTLMLMIFGGFFSFVIMPVIKQNTTAINNLADNFKEKMFSQDETLAEHNRRITDQEKETAVINSRLLDHIEKDN